MRISKITALRSAALLSLGVLGGTVVMATAHAQTGTGSQAQQTPVTPPSLSDAIAAAEAQTGGKAIEAEWKKKGQPGMVEVELMKPDGSKVEVMVNTADGSVQVMANDDDQNQNGKGSNDDDDDNG